MRPALIRPLLALVLVATFGVRTVAPELMRGCGPGTGVAHHDGEAGREHGHGHTGHPIDRCECVGYSFKVVIATPPVRAVLAAAVARFAVTLPVPATLVRRAGIEHLLPFAQAPPATRLA